MKIELYFHTNRVLESGKFPEATLKQAILY